MTALLVTSSGVLAAPARAAAQSCPEGYFCFWVDGNFSPDNAMGMVKGNVPHLGVFEAPLCPKPVNPSGYASWDNCISSYVNNTNRTIRVFEFPYYNIDDLARPYDAGWNAVPPHTSAAVMPLWRDSETGEFSSNDRISSILFE